MEFASDDMDGHVFRVWYMFFLCHRSDKEKTLRRVVEASQHDITCLEGQLHEALSQRHHLST